MGKAKVCDICNKILKSNRVSIIEIDVQPHPDIIHYNLCSDCTELLKQWIRQKKTKEKRVGFYMPTDFDKSVRKLD